MLQDKKDQICRALEDAADEVRGQSLEEHHRMVTAGPLPAWAVTVLKMMAQTLTPMALQAARQLIDQLIEKVNPTPPEAA